MEKNKEMIIRDLKEKGYRNKSINYQEFLEIYEPYKEEMKEREFAEILGISYAHFYAVKNKGTKAKVLKGEIEKERKEEIRAELKGQGYRNKLINYQEFLEIYEPYKEEMTKKEFAEILGISYVNLDAVKNRGTKARVLKGEIEKERKEEIRAELKGQGYRNKIINYQEFLKIYGPYRKEMTEKEFAEILGISDASLSMMKNKGRKSRILKGEIEEERKEEIRDELKGNLHRNKIINYQEFLDIYEPYQREMTKIEFAEILGISDVNFYALKNRGTRVKVLKEKLEIAEENEEERTEEIRRELQGKGYRNKLINYQEFLEIYEPYRRELTKREFIEILGISGSSLSMMKNKGRKSRILKGEIEEERKEEIRAELKGQGYRNKLINYQEFLEIYEPYRREMKKTEFAKILGISDASLSMMKNKGSKSRILKGEIEEERKEEIRAELKGQGYRNKTINYQEFLDIYEPYKKEMTETEFAEILGIAIANFKKIKSSGTRAKVLKGEMEEERKEEIREELKGQGYRNKTINYQEFLDIYEPYRKEMTEQEFAEILEVSYAHFYAVKNKGTRAKVLKEKIEEERETKELSEVKEKLEERTEEDVEKIVQDMERCYQNQMKAKEAIDYIIENYGISKEDLLGILNEEVSKKNTKEKEDVGEDYDDIYIY